MIEGSTGTGPDRPPGPPAGRPFETVVVPLDGSETAEAVLPRAKALADAFGARLVLLQVVPFPEPPNGHPSHGPEPIVCRELPDDVGDARQDAEGYLRDVGRRWGLGREAAMLVEVGDPFARIRAAALAHPRPLVVLTARATAVLPLARHSELARRLVFSGLAPVLVVPPEADSGASGR